MELLITKKFNFNEKAVSAIPQGGNGGFRIFIGFPDFENPKSNSNFLL
jgi:hypothetical protein